MFPTCVGMNRTRSRPAWTMSLTEQACPIETYLWEKDGDRIKIIMGRRKR